MSNQLKDLGEATAWRLMVAAAKKGAKLAGYELERIPGRGLSNVYSAQRNGKQYTVSIRTTRDRWIAFPPLAQGTKWKTLSDVDLVLVATVDSKEAPKSVETYLFSATEVRKRFDAAYAARVRAGNVVKDNFGMWVALDLIDSRTPNAVGSGILSGKDTLAVFSIDELIKSSANEVVLDEVGVPPSDEALLRSSGQATDQRMPRAETIADVVAWARQRISEIAGVRGDAVKLDLKLEI